MLHKLFSTLFVIVLLAILVSACNTPFGVEPVASETAQSLETIFYPGDDTHQLRSAMVINTTTNVVVGFTRYGGIMNFKKIVVVSYETGESWTISMSGDTDLSKYGPEMSGLYLTFEGEGEIDVKGEKDWQVANH